MGNINERVALITGGARGIGRAIGLDLAKGGWAVAYCYRRSEEDASTAARAIEQAGGRAMPVRCDVSSPGEVEAMVEKVEGGFGRIDAVINCAGPFHMASPLEETIEGWREMFANNLDHVFYTAKFAAPGMIRRKFGRIVSFSMAGADQLKANTAVTAHFIAKSAVLALSRALAKELAPHGVTVNCISPGFIDSGSVSKEELDGMKKKIPAGYIGTTEDVVASARYLLSDEARYVTGANIQVGGGWGI